MLLRLTAPAGTSVEDLRVTDDGRDVTEAFRRQPDGTALGLVTGLDLGDNVVRAELPGGRGARITLTNAPQGGPVLSGPQIQPWTCTNGSDRPDCSREPTVTWWYRSSNPQPGDVLPITTAAGQQIATTLQPYDPAAPPDDVATTTTDEGVDVPFIVREEVDPPCGTSTASRPCGTRPRASGPTRRPTTPGTPTRWS